MLDFVIDASVEEFDSVTVVRLIILVIARSKMSSRCGRLSRRESRMMRNDAQHFRSAG